MSLGIYVHLPYCISKCPYCDFNSYGTQGDFPEDKYLSSVLDEIELYRDLISKNSVKTVFFGGGTPSLFKSDSIKEILNGIDKYSDIFSGQEISLEVNPKTIDLKKLSELKDVGINRISVGVQSFNQRKLDFYGRISNSADCEKVLNDIKEAGYQTGIFGKWHNGEQYPHHPNGPWPG